MSQPESKSSQRRLLGKERQKQALDLRKSGATYDAIGQALGISTQGAYKAVIRALDSLNAKISEGAEQLRRLELERLDRLFLAVYPAAISGSFEAVDRALKVMARRARLLGLDAIEKAEISWREEVISLIRSGRVTSEQVIEELGLDLASELFVSAGISVVASRPVAAEGEEE